MSTQKFNIFLSSELWEESLVAGLARLGHTVNILKDAPGEVYISRHAWRIPASVGQAKLVEHVEMIMKQVRILEHADQTANQPEETDTKPSGATPRKRAAKKAVESSGVSIEVEGSDHLASVPTATPKPKRKVKVKDVKTIREPVSFALLDASKNSQEGR